MSNSFIRNFTSFQKKRNIEKENENPITESVKVINDRFIIGGIELKQSMINSYIKKVKDSTGQDLNNTFSKSEIAEQLINYLVDKHGSVDNIPPSALLGGEEEMVDQVDDISMEEEDVVVDEETIDAVEELETEAEDVVETEEEEVAEFEEESDDDVDFEDDDDDDFKDINEEEEEENDEEGDEEGEDADLPL